MIGTPQHANAKRTTAPIGIELIGKADTLSRLVNDPGDAGGFDCTEISDVVVMRKVDNKRVDRYGWRLTVAFHAMRVQQTVGPVGSTDLQQQKFAISERVPSGTVGELKPAEIGSKSQTDP
jgi:hypothetical protein